jgi:hypothetical protein
MSRTPTAIALVPLAVVAALSAAACTAEPAAAPAAPVEAAPTPPTDAVVWIDGFCAALVPVLHESEPVPVDFTDRQKAMDDATRSLDSLNTVAAAAIDGLDRLGPPPTSSEELLLIGTRPLLTAVRTSIADARSAIDGGSGPTFAVGTRTGLSRSVQQGSPVPDIVADSELSAAAARAGNCAVLVPPNR